MTDYKCWKCFTTEKEGNKDQTAVLTVSVTPRVLWGCRGAHTKSVCKGTELHNTPEIIPKERGTLSSKQTTSRHRHWELGRWRGMQPVQGPVPCAGAVELPHCSIVPQDSLPQIMPDIQKMQNAPETSPARVL